MLYQRKRNQGGDQAVQKARVIKNGNTMEKYCALCGHGPIASRMVWDYSARFNRIQYCPECRDKKRSADKAKWKQENRRDCRRRNKQLKTEIMLSNQRLAEMEEQIALIREENRRLKQNGYRTHTEDSTVKEIKEPGILSFFRKRKEAYS